MIEYVFILSNRLATCTIVVLLLTSNALLSQTLPSGFSQVPVATGLTFPTVMAFAPDGRIFICQQGGNVRVVKNNVLLPTPFLSLTVDATGERGLIGIVLDPDFSTNGYVYLYHTLPDGSRNRISRYTANGDVALTGSAQVILDLDPVVAPFHNGGAMHFGPDGKLYVAVGENGVGPNAQNLNTYFGKILRINPDGSIPNGNPFTDGSEQRRRIWSYGLRNPYTMDFQAGSGKFYVNDVGAMAWEEINDCTAGGLNYGWPTNEGIVAGTSFTNPIYAYGRTTNGLGCAITGGVFFNPTTTSYPAEYFGKYFFMDLCGRWIDFIPTVGAPVQTSFATNLPGQCLGLDVGIDGNLYYVSRANNAVYKIVYSSSQQPVITSHPAPQNIFESETAIFSVSAAGAQPLSYQWRKNGTNLPGATGVELRIDNASASDVAQYSVIVTNSFGSATSNDAQLLLLGVNNPPEPVITTPVNGSTYRGGDVISFSGTASDPENGTLPPTALRWQIDFHHNTHVHDSPPVAGIASGTYTVPVIGETAADVWYRIHLTATDLQGRSASVYRDVMPRLSQIRLETQPVNLELTLDGQPVSAPYVTTGVEGIQREIGLVTPQFSGALEYEFDHWVHGGSPTQSFNTPTDDVVYTAVFREVVVTDVTDGERDHVIIYPNPTTGSLIIGNTGNAEIFLYDVHGKNVGRWTNPDGRDSTSITFSLPEGVYYLKIVSANRVVIRKIIKK